MHLDESSSIRQSFFQFFAGRENRLTRRRRRSEQQTEALEVRMLLSAVATAPQIQSFASSSSTSALLDKILPLVQSGGQTHVNVASLCQADVKVTPGTNAAKVDFTNVQ